MSKWMSDLRERFLINILYTYCMFVLFPNNLFKNISLCVTQVIQKFLNDIMIFILNSLLYNRAPTSLILIRDSSIM